MHAQPQARAVSVVWCVVLAVASLAAACGLYLAEIAGAGFPDGHLTEYQRWILPYQRAAVGGWIALALGFAGLAAVRTRARAFVAALALAVVLALAVLLVLPAVGLQVLQLEHGQGG